MRRALFSLSWGPTPTRLYLGVFPGWWLWGAWESHCAHYWGAGPLFLWRRDHR